VVGGALLVAAVALLALLKPAMIATADAQARLRLGDVASMARRGELPPTLAGEDDGTVAQVVFQGRVLVQSPIIHGTGPLVIFVPAPGEVALRTVTHPPIGDDEGAYRVAATTVETPSGTMIVYAGAPLEPVNDSLEEAGLILAWVVPALIVLVGLTVWRLVGRTLEPVEAIRREVEEISATALDRRVPVTTTSDEIGRLARTMNEMLERLDGAAHRQRRFVADASHELRSPLATIRAKLEAALARPAPVDWPGLAAGWLAEQERLERLVEDLLLLARLDEVVAGRFPAVVDLDELVLRQARDVQARGKVHIDVSRVGGGRVHGDADQLRRMVGNLLDNAERHAATIVRCELQQRGETVRLVVSDDGPGIAPADRQRVFERFVRLDEARDQRAGGAGLGLAIVRDVVTAHGGTVVVAQTDAGANLVVRLPAAEAPAPAADDGEADTDPEAVG
jgi:signal transduction histidine kinase